MNTFLFILLAAYVVLNALDYFSTSLVISKGRGVEANPITKWLMGVFGKFWWISKLPVVALCWLLWAHTSAPNAIMMIGALDMLYAWVVWHNYQIAWRK